MYPNFAATYFVANELDQKVPHTLSCTPRFLLIKNVNSPGLWEVYEDCDTFCWFPGDGYVFMVMEKKPEMDYLCPINKETHPEEFI